MNHAGTPYQCRHLFADGHRCGCPSLRQEDFCYNHHTTRGRLASTPSRSGRPTFQLLAPEDRSTIQRNLGEVLQRLANDQIDPKRAALLLYGLSICSANLARSTPSVRDAEPIAEVVDDLTHGLIAPPDDRPRHDPRNTNHVTPADAQSGARRSTLELARTAIDQDATLELRLAAAAALLRETEAAYEQECAATALASDPIASYFHQPAVKSEGTGCPILSDSLIVGKGGISFAVANDRTPPTPPQESTFTQPPQHIGVDATHGPRYSQVTSRYSMAASG